MGGGGYANVPGTPIEPSLLALMRAEFTVGKRWDRTSMALQIVAVAAGLAGAVVEDDAVAWGATFVALFGLLLGYVCQLNAATARGLAERTRRAVILRDGLGWPLGPREEADLRLQFDPWAQRLATQSPDLGRSYFGSGVVPGPERLRDNLQESVFWQAHLSRIAANYALTAVVLLGFIVLGVVLLALTSVDRQDTRSAFAKTLAAVVPFLVTTNAVRLWWSLARQGTQLQQLDAALEETRRRSGSPQEIEVLRLAHEYDILVLEAPPVPDWIYRRNRDELDRRWATRLAAYAAPAPSGGATP